MLTALAIIAGLVVFALSAIGAFVVWCVVSYAFEKRNWQKALQ
jgi:hypothetical protein